MVNRATSETQLRQMLLALVILGIIGLVAELLLLENTDSFNQWIPLVSLGAGLGAAVAVWIAPGRLSLRVFQVALVAFVVAGAFGIYLHFVGNVEWVRERDPGLGGMALVWKALTSHMAGNEFRAPPRRPHFNRMIPS